jgi:hypothetical protein
MDVEGQIIAMHPDMSRYLGTNPAGSLLWKELSDGATRAELAAALRDEYGIDEERATADVGAFLAALDENELLATTD